MELSIEHSTIVDRLITHVLTGNELNERDQEMFDRLDYAYSQLLRPGFMERDVVEMLRQRFDGLSKVTCYRYILQAKRVFGELHKLKEELQLPILYNLALRNFNLAMEKKDSRGAAAAMRNMVNIVLAANKETTFDFTKLEQHINMLVVNLNADEAIKIDLNSVETMKLQPDAREQLMAALKRNSEEVQFEAILNDADDGKGS